MKKIENETDYPNMLPSEIIKLDYSLSGDALRRFAIDVQNQTQIEMFKIMHESVDEMNELELF